jgi:hypothetical protein
MKTNEYDIRQYSDEELLTILDLTHNPTDRELEAKIIFNINKYKHIAGESAEQLSVFFEDIYSHFFDLSDEQTSIVADEIEELENTIEEVDNIAEKDKNADEGFNNNASNKNTTVIEPQAPRENEAKVGYTSNLTYTRGQLNPLLQQTIKRVISIDSQYRDNKDALSTEFTFDLSDPLKDVVSLKLYSVQIPYTWYTINNDFGSNFFVIKGNSPGIDNGNHDYTITVSAGNYSPQELVDAINENIDELKTISTDVSFGNTSMSLNQQTSRVKLNLGFEKQYNETSYYLNFPNGTSAFAIDEDSPDASLNLRRETIPSFLGFEDSSYNLFHIDSTKNLPLESDIANANETKSFVLDNTNNFFTVYKYIGPNEEVGVPSNVDLSFNVTLSLTTGVDYVRSQLVTQLKIDLLNNEFLSTESSINRITTDDGNNSFFELRLKPDRNTTNNKANSKIKVIFPTPGSTDVFVGANSCFRFQTHDAEFNTVVSTYASIQDESTSFDISQNIPRVVLSCSKPYFNLPANDISFSIPTTTTPYSLNQVINTLDNQLKLQDYIIENNSGVSLNSAGYLEIAFDVLRDFQQNEFQVTIPGSGIFTDLGYAGGSTTTQGTGIIGDTQIITIGFQINDRTTYAITDYNLFNVTPHPSLNNLSGDLSYNVVVPIQSGNLISKVNLKTIFENTCNNIFVDDDNVNVLSGTTFTTQTSATPNKLDCSLNISISKQLSEDDFSVQFQDLSDNVILDTSDNIWFTQLQIDRVMVDTSFSLLNSSYVSSDVPGADLSFNVTNALGTIIGRGVRSNGVLTDPGRFIEITSNNSQFQLVPFEDGVVDSKNTLSFTIPDGNYSRTQLLTAMNNKFTGTVASKSSIGIYTDSQGHELTKIRITIDKTYTPSDYKLLFFDPISFAKCFSGVSSVRNATWDTTLGWILGYRAYTSYVISELAVGTYVRKKGNQVEITGDTTISTNLFNYLLLSLNDYNQNHLNDGLITVAPRDTFIQPSSYTNRTNFVCDPNTGELVYNTSNDEPSKRLTQNQIYSVTQIANSKNVSNIITSTEVTGNSFGTGPFEKDVFGLIPLKLSGLRNGESYVEFAGTLQNQERSYFGPVNIKRMTVKLKTDRGNVLDLNGSNWSFSLVCEQLYRQNPGNGDA